MGMLSSLGSLKEDSRVVECPWSEDQSDYGDSEDVLALVRQVVQQGSTCELRPYTSKSFHATIIAPSCTLYELLQSLLRCSSLVMKVHLPVWTWHIQA